MEPPRERDHAIRVFIVDDHPVVRRGLIQILSDETDMEVVGEATSSQEILGKLRSAPSDVVLLDLAIPGRGGLEVLSDLKREHPRLAVIILSAYPEEQYGLRALKAGAAGYVSKDHVPAELVNAVRKVAEGGKYVSSSLADQLVSYLTQEGEKAPHQQLTDREYQVLCLIASGKTVGQIAKALGLSAKTISTHRTRILEKMNLATNAELMRYAMTHGLV
jgi:DNA-binding NarL/FixJ family response regulator